MGIELERKLLLARVRKDSRSNQKEFSRKLKLPYQTLRCLLDGRSMGTIKTWLRVERFYARLDAKDQKTT